MTNASEIIRQPTPPSPTGHTTEAEHDLQQRISNVDMATNEQSD